MTKGNPSTAPETESKRITSEVIGRFIAAFQNRDVAAFAELVGQDCVMETTQPPPNGERVEGYDDNVRYWQAMLTSATRSFDVEEVVVCADRAIIRWRLRWGEGEEQSVRAVNLMRVCDGKIVEALAYAKTILNSNQGQLS